MKTTTQEIHNHLKRGNPSLIITLAIISQDSFPSILHSSLILPSPAMAF